MSKVLLSEEFSYLFEEVSSSNSFIEFLRNVVELLNDGNINIKYTLSADNISFEEESYIKIMTGKDISSFDHDIITFKNFRIFYFSGSDDPRYYNFDFSSKSKINVTINNFTTWIIWGNANNDRFIISVLIDIISKRIFRSLNNHNSNIPVFYDLNKYTINLDIGSNNLITISKFIMTFYIVLFSTLDNVISLKYDDFDKIFPINTNISILGKYITKKQIEKLYRNSITVPRSEQDDRNCFIELLEYIVNPLQNYSNDKNEE